GVDPHQIERLYRVVMDMSVAHQEATVRNRPDAPLRVTYQGVEGSYSHLTAQRRYGGRPGGALLAGHDTFRAAAAAVVHGQADLALVATGIQSAAGNATRFVEVALRPAPVPGDAVAKTSLVLALADRPGALGEVLMRFAARGLSLTKLESRPIPSAPFTYRFYV